MMRGFHVLRDAAGGLGDWMAAAEDVEGDPGEGVEVDEEAQPS